MARNSLLPSIYTKLHNTFARINTVWAQVRDDNNKDIDWVLIGYDGDSKTDMTVVDKGNGGVEAISSKLPSDTPVFGGIRLTSKNRFVQFLYVGEDVPGIKRGRTLMYKNGASSSELRLGWVCVWVCFCVVCVCVCVS